LESAFGSKTNVFYIHKAFQPQSTNWRKPQFAIFIHPQAASFVCRNVFDILIFLAKTFPEQFVSLSQPNLILKNISSSMNTPTLHGKSESQESSTSKIVPNFFDVLMRHDSIHVNKKTKTSKHSMLTFS